MLLSRNQGFVLKSCRFLGILDSLNSWCDEFGVGNFEEGKVNWTPYVSYGLLDLSSNNFRSIPSLLITFKVNIAKLCLGKDNASNQT